MDGINTAFTLGSSESEDNHLISLTFQLQVSSKCCLLLISLCLRRNKVKEKNKGKSVDNGKASLQCTGSVYDLWEKGIIVTCKNMKKSKWEIRENEDRKERRKKTSGKYLIYLCIFVWFTILTFIILVKYFTAVILKIIEFTYRVSVRSNSHSVSGLNMFKQG